MASTMTSEPGDGLACAVCLETPDALKVVTTCKHLCCVECLSKLLKTMSVAGKSFPCPICQVECPLVENGVDGLGDYTRAEECDEDQVTTEAIACFICRTTGTTIKAESRCQECGNVYFCRDCTEIHGRNNATANHVVISLASATGQTGGSCRIHNALIGNYCHTCEKPCCGVCVFLDHGDHDVKKIWDEFRSVLQEVQHTSEEYENRSNHMKSIKKQIIFLKNSEVSSRRDILIREIEDHSEKCIQQIIKQKEELKEKVRQDYKVVSDIYDWLEKIPALDKLDNAIAKSKTLLPKAEPHPADIVRLSNIKRQIVDSVLPGVIDVDEYMESFTRLFRNPTKFVPYLSALSLGELVAETRTNDSIKACKLVFEKELPVDDKAKYIPCVANLGNDFYAIAHPTVEGTPSNAIDIYKLPGDFQRTITDYVNPVYDIAATHGGQLAVLSDGQTQESCSVRMFNPATGQMKSSRDVIIRNPISFDINICQQYVILSKDEEQRVTVVNEDGSVECSKVVGKVEDHATRICCAGERNILMSMNCVFDDMNPIMTSSLSPYSDIIALFGEVNMCCVYNNIHKLKRSTLTGRLLDKQVSFEVCAVTGLKPQARLSVKGGYIVTSQEHTLRVLKEI